MGVDFSDCGHGVIRVDKVPGKIEALRRGRCREVGTHAHRQCRDSHQIHRGRPIIMTGILDCHHLVIDGKTDIWARSRVVAHLAKACAAFLVMRTVERAVASPAIRRNIAANDDETAVIDAYPTMLNELLGGAIVVAELEDA